MFWIDRAVRSARLLNSRAPVTGELLELVAVEAEQALDVATRTLRRVRALFDASLTASALSAPTRERQETLSRAVLIAELRVADCARRAHQEHEAVELLRAATARRGEPGQ